MEFLDGKKLQKKFLNEIKTTISLLEIRPKLFVFFIEEQESKRIYFKQIKKMCEEVGIDFDFIYLEATTETNLLNLIEEKNQDSTITSILILAPLPFYLDENKIYQQILPRKDVECLGSEKQFQIYFQNTNDYPCTVSGIISLLNFHNIDVDEKNVVIINRSKRVGKPLFSYFLNKNCTVTMMHSYSKNQEFILKQADLVITAIGRGPILDGSLFKKGSTVIDLGMFYEQGKWYGDISLENEVEISNYLSHTGGIGPMTIASLAQNILNSYYLSQGDK